MIFCVEDDQAIRDLMLYALNSAPLDLRQWAFPAAPNFLSS